VLVDIDARGEVGRVEIARWAGYGLDQSVIDTVKQMHFFPQCATARHRDAGAAALQLSQAAGTEPLAVASGCYTERGHPVRLSASARTTLRKSDA